MSNDTRTGCIPDPPEDASFYLAHDEDPRIAEICKQMREAMNEYIGKTEVTATTREDMVKQIHDVINEAIPMGDLIEVSVAPNATDKDKLDILITGPRFLFDF